MSKITQHTAKSGAKKHKRHSFFGVTLPVWEPENYGSGTATLTFILTGKLVSKKNNQMAVVSHVPAQKWLKEKANPTFADFKTALKMCKAVFIGNKEYRECRDKFLPELIKQKAVWEARLGPKGLKFPIEKAAMTVRFYFKDRYVTDTVNKQQTLQDLLVEAGIIANDDYKTINPIHSESGLYKDKIRENISLIRLAVRLPKCRVKLTDELK